MTLYDNIEKTAHIGETFVLWLCCKSSLNDAYFPLRENRSLELTFDSDMTFRSNFANSETTKLSGAAPAYSLEAKHALRQNKIIADAKIKIKYDEKEWGFNVISEELALTSIKIPAQLTSKTDEKLYERQYLIEELLSLVEELYYDFLCLRLDESAWEKEAHVLQNWIQHDE